MSYLELGGCQSSWMNSYHLSNCKGSPLRCLKLTQLHGPTQQSLFLVFLLRNRTDITIHDVLHDQFCLKAYQPNLASPSRTLVVTLTRARSSFHLTSHSLPTSGGGENHEGKYKEEEKDPILRRVLQQDQIQTVSKDDEDYRVAQ